LKLQSIYTHSEAGHKYSLMAKKALGYWNRQLLHPGWWNKKARACIGWGHRRFSW